MVETIRPAPGVPMERTGSPSFKSSVGAMVVRIRFPGARLLGSPGRVLKLAISLFRMMPVPGTATLAPKKLEMVWVSVTTFPS